MNRAAIANERRERLAEYVAARPGQPLAFVGRAMGWPSASMARAHAGTAHGIGAEARCPRQCPAFVARVP